MLIDQRLCQIPRHCRHSVLWWGSAIYLLADANNLRSGFLTTFTMLARDSFTVKEIWWMMVYVFFGQPRPPYSAKKRLLIENVEYRLQLPWFREWFREDTRIVNGID